MALFSFFTCEERELNLLMVGMWESEKEGCFDFSNHCQVPTSQHIYMIQEPWPELTKDPHMIPYTDNYVGPISSKICRRPEQIGCQPYRIVGHLIHLFALHIMMIIYSVISLS